MGLLVKIEDAPHAVGHCQRCHHVVEPLISTQWFVKMKPLVKAAVECVEDGRIQFVPNRFTKTYTNWMDNIHDWCISRQIWWGHRIPVWYCDDCGKQMASRTDLTECPHCHSHHTSIRMKMPLIPGSVPVYGLFPPLAGRTRRTNCSSFYPTSVLVTGYDIIFFWLPA